MTLNIFIPIPDLSFLRPLGKSLGIFFSGDISIMMIFVTLGDIMKQWKMRGLI